MTQKTLPGFDGNVQVASDGCLEMREIPGASGYYINVHGEVFSRKKGRLHKLSTAQNATGTLMVALYVNRKRTFQFINRLLLLTFVGPAPHLDAVAAHKDGNAENNKLCNLQWQTRKQVKRAWRKRRRFTIQPPKLRRTVQRMCKAPPSPVGCPALPLESVEHRHCLNAKGYCVSVNGEVFSCLATHTRKVRFINSWRRRRLQKSRHSPPYLSVSIAGAGSRFVHHLVLEAFRGPRPPGMEACHNNGDRSDNRICNLRWDTRLSNSQDASVRMRGSKLKSSKLREEDIPVIRRLYSEGTPQHEIAEQFCVGQYAVSQIIRGLSWCHVPSA